MSTAAPTPPSSGTDTKRVLIIGAGIAGPVLALFLHRFGFHPSLYEASPGPASGGVGLTIMVNGVKVLAAAGLADPLKAITVEYSEGLFENQHGELLTRFSGGDPARYGQPSITVTRAELHRVVLEAVAREGIPVHYDKRLTAITDAAPAPVTATFEDGSSAEGEALIAADGIHSRTRQLILPNAPRPQYTGLMAPGGFSPYAGTDPITPGSKQPLHFVHGQDGFFGFGHMLTADGPRTMWWSTSAQPLPTREALAAQTTESVRAELLRLHGDWAEPIPSIIRSSAAIVSFAIHDVSELSRWHVGRVLLIGDAAHAVAPHSGQGASMALEDAQLCAKLLRDHHFDLSAAFTAFEAQRRPRTDRVIAIGRRNGQRKRHMGAFAYWISQILIRNIVPFFVKREMDESCAYTIDM